MMATLNEKYIYINLDLMNHIPLYTMNWNFGHAVMQHKKQHQLLISWNMYVKCIIEVIIICKMRS